MVKYIFETDFEEDMAIDYVAEEIAFFASIDEAMKEEEEQLKADINYYEDIESLGGFE